MSKSSTKYEFELHDYTIFQKITKANKGTELKTILTANPHQSEPRVKFKHYSNLAVPVELVVQLMEKIKSDQKYQ